MKFTDEIRVGLSLKFNRILSKNLRITLVVALVCFSFWIFVWYSSGLIKNQILGGLPKASATIGQIIKTEHKVLRNFSGQLIWQSAEPGDPIYVGNSIQTLEDSNTILQLSDGQKVDIAANSLVRIQTTEDGLSLELIDGEIQVETVAEAKDAFSFPEATLRKEFTVKTKKGILKTRNSNLKITQKKNSNVEPKIEINKPALKQKATPTKVASLVEVTEVGLLSKPELHQPTFTSQKVVLKTAPILPANPPAVPISETIPQTKTAPTLIREPAAQKTRSTLVKKEKNLPLPEKKPLQAPKFKRVDVKVTE